jgi:redox-sensitive bicupin YhaK (pirin superfamily)
LGKARTSKACSSRFFSERRCGSYSRDRNEADNRSLVLFDRGDELTVQAGNDGIRFLLVSGKPLEEPVAWYGPIVMNTQEQLQQAFQELERGTFLKQEGRS